MTTPLWNDQAPSSPEFISNFPAEAAGNWAYLEATIGLEHTFPGSLGPPQTGGVHAIPVLASLPSYDASGRLIILTGSNPGVNDTLEWYSNGNWQSAAATQAIRSLFKNLVVTVIGTTTLTLTADELMLEDASGNFLKASAVSLSLNIVTTGANGLDTGSAAEATWYYVFAIYNPTTSTLSGLLSLPATAPTLPTGYTLYARLGAVQTIPTAATLYYTLQKGRKAQYVVQSGNAGAFAPNLNLPAMTGTGTIGNVSTPTWESVAVAPFVPPTASEIIVVLNWYNGFMIVAPNPNYGGLTSEYNPPPLQAKTGTLVGNLILESSSIYYALDNSGAVHCLGWIDNI